jgi:hypothetical protein
MDKVQKTIGSQYYTPSSEPFRIKVYTAVPSRCLKLISLPLGYLYGRIHKAALNVELSSFKTKR